MVHFKMMNFMLHEFHLNFFKDKWIFQTKLITVYLMLVILRSTIMTMAMQHKGQEGGMKYMDIRLLHYM